MPRRPPKWPFGAVVVQGRDSAGNTGKARRLRRRQRLSHGKNGVQLRGIVRDFGTFDTPDAFYAAHGTNLRGFKRWLFENLVRQSMNRNVEQIRQNPV